MRAERYENVMRTVDWRRKTIRNAKVSLCKDEVDRNIVGTTNDLFAHVEADIAALGLGQQHWSVRDSTATKLQTSYGTL